MTGPLVALIWIAAVSGLGGVALWLLAQRRSFVSRRSAHLALLTICGVTWSVAALLVFYFAAGAGLG